MKFNKKDLGLFIFLAALFVFFMYTRIDNKRIKESKYEIVNDASTFFTVDGCVDRYIYALSSMNSEDVVNLLSNGYKIKNFINKDNVLEKMGAKEGLFEFKAKKIYYVELDKTFTKYYVYGLLVEEREDEMEYGNSFYMIVTINTKDDLFTVEPYDGKIFRESNNANN